MSNDHSPLEGLTDDGYLGCIAGILPLVFGIPLTILWIIALSSGEWGLAAVGLIGPGMLLAAWSLMSLSVKGRPFRVSREGVSVWGLDPNTGASALSLIPWDKIAAYRVEGSDKVLFEMIADKGWKYPARISLGPGFAKVTVPDITAAVTRFQPRLVTE